MVEQVKKWTKKNRYRYRQLIICADPEYVRIYSEAHHKTLYGIILATAEHFFSILRRCLMIWLRLIDLILRCSVSDVIGLEKSLVQWKVCFIQQTEEQGPEIKFLNGPAEYLPSQFCGA